MSLPNTTYADDYYVFHWHDSGAQIVLERFVAKKDDISCEATVNYHHETRGGRLFSGRLLLLGPRSRQDVVRACQAREPDLDWGAYLEQACRLARERYRQGDDMVDLALLVANVNGHELTIPWLVEPLVFDSPVISILYGDGGSGKSLMAIMLAAVVAGVPHDTFTVSRTCPVAYFDWEDDANSHAARLSKLLRIEGLAPGRIWHKRCSAPLSEMARELRRQMASRDIGFAVIDSVGMAAGDPESANAIVETFRAMRSLGVPVLAIHHLPKDARDKSKPFGSVYASNEARLTWHIERSGEEDESSMYVSLRNYKINHGRLLPRMAFQISFDDAIDIRRVNPADIPELHDTLSQPAKILLELKRNAKSAEDLSEVLEIPTNQVRAILSRLKEKGQVIRVGDLWGIPVRNEHGD